MKSIKKIIRQKLEIAVLLVLIFEFVFPHYAIALEPENSILLPNLVITSAEEIDFIEKNKEKFLSLDEIQGPVYLTVDLDVFDPGFAPEVGTPEPIGKTPQEVFDFLKKVCAKKLIGLDVVECSSDTINTPTALLGAQIIKKVLLWK